MKRLSFYRPGCGSGRNPSRTPPLRGFRTAGPSVGRTPPGPNPTAAEDEDGLYRRKAAVWLLLAAVLAPLESRGRGRKRSVTDG
jgi:hypothetical protein